MSLIFSSQCLVAGEKEDAWRALSARSQNLHYQLMLMGEDTAADPSMHEDDLKVIVDSLDTLVKIGELKSKKITLKQTEKVGDMFSEIWSEVEKLGLTYGIFMAREMCDLGARRSFSIITAEEQIVLHLRMPEKALVKFETSLLKLNVVVEKDTLVETPKK
ncbi:hypothetical protein N9Z15_04975 [Akkermansiaceae bacterium]|nr:hypothetical protein [Akkermansiaceae bacterium]